MTTRFSFRPNRQQRRATARRQARAMAHLTGFPLDADDIIRLGDVAQHVTGEVLAAELGVTRSIGEAARRLVVLDADGTPRETPFGHMRAPLLAFAAAELLRGEGIAARVVAGRAIWPVDAGEWDTLDHGVQTTGRLMGDVVSGRYHTWLEAGGCIMDFAARELPSKFETAHEAQPFSTPPMIWRQFLQTIIHPLGRSMSNPLGDANSAYAYWDGGLAMLALVRRALAQYLARTETLAEASAAHLEASK